MKKVLKPLIAVIVLALIPWLGVTYGKLDYVFAIIIPYAAGVILALGMLFRLVDWLRRPVPFNIPTTCGQEKSLDWVKTNTLECPSNPFMAALRVLSEVFLFRSLFRNTKAEMAGGPKLVYGSHKWLWLGGLAFHWSMLIIVIRHARFFLATLPVPIELLDTADRFLDVTVPAFYITDAVALAAITFLVLRRLSDAKMRILSLSTDYFPLFLFGAIAIVGISMRYVTKVNIMPVKALAMTLASFGFSEPEPIGALFYVHLFLVCVLLAYIPFSKLVHMGGIFLSPTRNLPNNSRAKWHKNPWNPDIKFRTYAEYEDEFREKMKKAGIPVEKQ
ncbi:menaquinol oxidoreductase [Chlorobaculum sp. 24CR]|uniref:sulfate reduction electron transfer complex DsrMKJOP subunit DsrM n=1 Tax=Chlorobaculum sp. 24CR TaxID=2508878 RepID=UPI00100C202B|nr:sulfate reduction electron transfer complex DsrMKJOP subunit DsrM [Chlorobaculum sp. 24CR]RXK89570.1 menaquinol oxidoreductase [Chlorobaculum sp. 24CR]